ncbi:hypothetical protein [Prosthecobacter sp.]|uniref:CAF17-like 4Fe-4S cluster assembly/insertion protein YgfZ n=1 Tax=Prosthecobacter sp. TaxID=1965333 RepID=UPI001DC789CF|nr:hypothetical protein [Prosthecobacter sp.]MCB1276705.1 hypothetical protein [Prosthecobacter sp.]
MTAESFHQITAHGAAANLSARAKFRLTGADRVRYLNGQVTNDVRRTKSDETIYACVTDAKGRIAADVFVHSTADALLLDAEPDLREALGMRLERYIVADDVELTDVTDDWQLWHVFGDASTQGLRSTRFGIEGCDVWLPAGETFESPCPVLTEEDLETWRVLQKVPRWPNELNADTFPPEAGITGRAMDFAKGCYIGQEVLSRIKTTGKMPRELMAWAAEAPLTAGTEILNTEGKAVGTITSVAIHPETGDGIGLAFVRQGTPQIALTASGVSLKQR